MRFWIKFFTALFITLNILRAGEPDIEQGVHLILSTKQIEPTTTFEVRFDEPVAAFEQVGLEAKEPPLVLAPALAGKFTWLSQRSGVFVPDEPTALETNYRITLRPGLRKADGTPLAAKLLREMQTPPLSVNAFWPNEFSEKNAPANPEIVVQFNTDIEAGAAKKFIVFRDDANHETPALVRHAKGSDSYYFSRGDARPWKERFYAAKEKSHTRDENEKAADTVPHRLIVTPAQPLPVGKGWRLVLEKDLPSADGATRLPEAVELKIGDVIPFAVQDATANNGVEGGKRIVLSFPKRISPLLKDADLPKWVAIAPAPANLKVEAEWDEIVFTGDFKLEERYTVSVKAGFPAAGPFATAKDFTKTVAFEPLPPRLYFPAFSAHQISGGVRRFDLRTVNVDDVLVTAKLLTAESLVPALRGYNEAYYKNGSEKDSILEPYREFAGVAGKTIYEKKFQPFVERDAARIVSLNWDEILAGQKTGAVLLTAQKLGDGPRLGTQSLVQLTDLGLVWKQAHGEAWVYVFSHATGRPVAGAAVRAMSDDGTALASKNTDAGGLVSFPIPKNTRWLLAGLGDDLHAVSFQPERSTTAIGDREQHELPLYQFRIPIEWNQQNAGIPRDVLLFTERNAYQPGETVHLKAIVRERKGGELVVPARLKGVLTCLDSRQQVFLEKKVALSADGSLDEAVRLPDGALGEYTASLGFDDDDRIVSQNFQVEEYKPNAFEITVKAKETFGPDETVEVPITAKYFFGTPLAKAAVRWSIEVYDSGFRPKGFGKFIFGWQVDDEALGGRSSSSFSAQGKGAVDEKGVFVLKPKITTNPKAPQPRETSVLAEITDQNQQTISTRARFVKHSSEFYLGVKRFADDVLAGQPVPVGIVAVNADGTPRAAGVKAKVTLQRIDWHTVREEGAGGALTYRNEAEIVNISEQEAATVRAEKSDTDESEVALPDEDGKRPSSLTFTPAEPGTYLLRVAAKDAAGHEILTATTFSVVGKKETSWAYRNEVHIDLVPDKQTYAPGETATILIKTPIAGEALVTIERERVLRTLAVTLDGNAPTIRVPIERGDAPNVFVSVLLVRGHEKSPRKIKMPEYRVGYCQINVVRTETKLAVSVQADAPDYRPGENVTVDATVKDSTGRAVKDAEVTLYAVDEGVLSLMDFERPDPFSFFYATRPLAVKSALSLPGLFPEDPDQRTFANKGFLVGAAAMKGAVTESHVRNDFLACAFWKADLRTDGDGRVRTMFRAPDSLTRYRVIAVAQTRKSQFGSGESSFEINKPLMCEPALPRFANLGDKAVMRAVLHNRTDTAGEVELNVQLDRTAVAAGNGERVFDKKIRVPAHGSQTVDFPVEFQQTGAAKWMWKARLADAANEGGFFEDAVETTLHVGQIAPLLHETLVGRTSDAEANLLDGANPQFLESNGTIAVSLANTRLVGLGGAVSYLDKYPYGCAEQTASRLIPWILAADLERAIPDLRKSPDEVNAAITRGINRLLSMQTPGGGLAFWPGGSEPMFWASAWGGLALATAQRHGHAVPVASLDEICGYLSKQLRDTAERRDDYELSQRCLALYTLALAGKPEPAYHEIIFKKRDALSAESRALLALAILESHGPAEMVEELIDSKMPAQPQGGIWFGSGERELAVRLMAWSQHRPKDRAVDTLSEELLHARKQGHWWTTQGNAWALLALTKYAAQVETGVKKIAGSVRYGGAQDEFRLDEKTRAFETGRALVPTDAAKPEPQPFQLANPSRGLLFTVVKIEGRPRVGRQPRQDRGYLIQRSYSKILDDGSQADANDWHVGDRVLVTLRIEVRQAAHYLAVDDPLPAVFEAVNPVFKSQQMKAADDAGGDSFTDFRELREDRALFFADHVAPGNYTIRYLARVRAAGEVTAPAAKIEEMYHPERFGMTETTQLTSLPLN